MSLGRCEAALLIGRVRQPGWLCGWAVAGSFLAPVTM